MTGAAAVAAAASTSHGVDGSDSPDRRSVLLAAHAVLAAEGHDELHFGHVSWIDREAECVWLKRGDYSFSATGPDDLVCVDLNGRRLSGAGPLHSEVWLHLGIYAQRPDVASIAHSHAADLAAYSSVGPRWPVLDQYTLEMSHRLTFHDSPRLVIDAGLGSELANSLGDGRACFLRSHGALVADTSIEAAVVGIVELGRAVGIIRRARSLGDVTEMSPQEREAMLERFVARADNRIRNMWGQLMMAQTRTS